MIKTYLFLLLLGLFLCIPSYIKAQIVIKGRIVTLKDVPVPNAPIVLRPTSKTNILAYTMTS